MTNTKVLYKNNSKGLEENSSGEGCNLFCNDVLYLCKLNK